MRRCQFCRYQDLSLQLLYVTPTWVAMVSRRPLSRGHLIIFPRRHVTNPGNLTANESRSLFRLIKKTSSQITNRFGCSGWHILMNYGKSAGQSIEHIHFHLVPRYATEKRSPLWPLVSRSAYKQLQGLTPLKIQSLVKNLKSVPKKKPRKRRAREA